MARAGPQRPSFCSWSLGAKMRGLPLADGWRAVLVTIRGDLDWFQKMLHLLRVNAAKPSRFCDCDSRDDSVPWSDFRDRQLCRTW